MGDRSKARAIWLAQHVLPHEPALRHWLGRRVGPSLDVDDVVQETYAKLALMESVSHIARPKSYMFQTARSILLQEVRRSRIVPIEAMSDLGEIEIADGTPLPDQHAEARQEWQRVSAAIDDLPERCRQIFLMRRLHGLSQRQIAERLGLSESTVENQIGRGTRLLSDKFGRGGKHAIGASKEMKMDPEQADDARDQRRN